MEFTFAAKRDKKRVFDLLQGRYEIRFGKTRKSERVLYDTFDWRIYAAGMKVEEVREDGPTVTEWREKDGGTLLGRVEGGTAVLVGPKAAGPQWERLKQVLKHRALMPVIRMEVSARLADLCDRRGKIVARLAVETATVHAGKGRAGKVLPTVLKLGRLKGYEQEHAQLVADLEKTGLIARAAFPVLDQIFEAAGIAPMNYSSKISINLDPAMKSEQAMRKILARLADTMEKNRKGTIADIDTEFLHDFRVAVRRTRSGLGQMKSSVPPGTLDRYRTAFGWLGEITGPTRDLDVYLLKFDEYAGRLPPSTAKNLEPLRRHLVKRQKEEQGKLAAELSGERYAKLIAGWKKTLEKPWRSRAAGWEGMLPAGEAAGQRILKLHKKVMKLGARLRDDSPPSSVHELRIACKKLRYMIEFFRSFYDEDMTREPVERLKDLQDVLGDFQDYEVHRQKLYGFAEELWKSKTASPALLLAMGELAESLSERQRKARSEIAGRFGAFAVKEEAEKFKEVFLSERERTGSDESGGHLQH